ncbi:MAG: hypothetical protein RB292_02765 [Patescibacteria group bacterium]|jgi:uridine kinase|nr:hypothetical protein [Patescibacteria group bacterium]
MDQDPNQKIVEAIIKLIKKWQRELPNKKLIIGIDGPSGLGKTVILKELAYKNKDITAVHLDYFMYSSAFRRKALESYQNKCQVFEEKWYKTKLIKKMAKDFRSARKKYFVLKNICYKKNKGPQIIQLNLNNEVLLVEGIFLKNTKMFENIFDKIIFIKLKNEYLEKRIKRRFDANYPNGDYEAYRRSMINFNNAWQKYLKDYQPDKTASSILNIKIVNHFS